MRIRWPASLAPAPGSGSAESEPVSPAGGGAGGADTAQPGRRHSSTACQYSPGDWSDGIGVAGSHWSIWWASPEMWPSSCSALVSKS